MGEGTQSTPSSDALWLGKRVIWVLVATVCQREGGAGVSAAACPICANGQGEVRADDVNVQ